MYPEWKERFPERIVPLVPCQSMFLLQFRGGVSLQFGSTPPLMACDCCVHSWWDARLSEFFRFSTTAAAFLSASPCPRQVQASRKLPPFICSCSRSRGHALLCDAITKDYYYVWKIFEISSPGLLRRERFAKMDTVLQSYFFVSLPLARFHRAPCYAY